MLDHGYCDCSGCETEREEMFADELAVNIEELKAALARPIVVTPSGDHTTGLLPSELAPVKSQYEIDRENIQRLHKFNESIEEAQAVLRRYNNRVKVLSVFSAATTALAILGALMLTTYAPLGWMLLCSGVVSTMIFSGHLGGEIFDAHKTKERVPGEPISMHPAEILRRAERAKTNWLNS